MDYFAPILAELQKLLQDGETAYVNETISSYPVRKIKKLNVLGVHIDGLDFNQDMVRYSSWRSEPNGKVSIIVRPYGYVGKTNRYPQKKDGTHSYDKIAQDVYNYAKAAVEDRKVKDVLDINLSTLREFAKANDIVLGIYGEGMVQASKDAKAPVSLHINGNFTFEDAAEIIKILKKTGHVK
jgi:hypothetical protein